MQGKRLRQEQDHGIQQRRRKGQLRLVQFWCPARTIGGACFGLGALDSYSPSPLVLPVESPKEYFYFS